LEFIRSQVGDRYLMSELTQRQWVLGGESSGHILCLDKTTTGDGIISALQVLFALRDSGGAFSELCKDLKKFPQCMVNVPIKDKDAASLMKNKVVQESLKAAEETLGNKGRVLLRPSGTEPLIRVMVEGEDNKLVDQLATHIASCIAHQS